MNKQVMYLGITFIGAAISLWGNSRLKKEMKRTAYIKVNV